MKLIIGLGNPGAKYEGTRHNVGFTCLDRIAEYNNVVFKQKFNGYSCEFASDGEKIILLKPDTFMNNSGGFIFGLFYIFATWKKRQRYLV